MTALYVTDPGSCLQAQNQQFLVLAPQQLHYQVSAKRVDQILMFGKCDISHGAANLALTHEIPVSYLCAKGRYFGRLDSAGATKPKYLAQQIKCSRQLEFTRTTAESMIRATLHNCYTLLVQLNPCQTTAEVQNALQVMALLMEHLPLASSHAELQDCANKAANLYFKALGALLPKAFGFSKRIKRQATDPINSLLNLGYILLSQTVYAGVQAGGLEAHLGNWHADRDCCPALVADLMAEFGALLVDSLVADLVISEALTPEDFMEPDEAGGIYLYPYALKMFLKYWEEKLQTTVIHLATRSHVSYRQCLGLQVQEYAACLMEKERFYRPMLWKP